MRFLSSVKAMALHFAPQLSMLCVDENGSLTIQSKKTVKETSVKETPRSTRREQTKSVIASKTSNASKTIAASKIKAEPEKDPEVIESNQPEQPNPIESKDDEHPEDDTAKSGPLEIDVEVAQSSRSPEDAAKIMADQQTLRELKNKCTEHNLNTNGKKIDLATRIINYERHADNIVVVS